jgi:hypothetical protein
MSQFLHVVAPMMSLYVPGMQGRLEKKQETTSENKKNKKNKKNKQKNLAGEFFILKHTGPLVKILTSKAFLLLFGTARFHSLRMSNLFHSC